MHTGHLSGTLIDILGDNDINRLMKLFDLIFQTHFCFHVTLIREFRDVDRTCAAGIVAQHGYFLPR